MLLRQANIKKLAKHEFGPLILGAGINGGVSAASLVRKFQKMQICRKK
jgi:hypothetical protein